MIVGAINAQSLFNEIFREAVSDFNIAIYHGKELLYQRHPLQKPDELQNSITYMIKEPYWSITSWPVPELAAKQHSWSPMVVLFVGFLISVMLSLITYLAQIARKNAQKAKEEISTRQKAEQQLIMYSKKLKKLSLVDPLTGVDNRRSLSTLMQSELAYMKENDTPLSIILIDLDHFKQINDTYGHVAGDHVLQKVGNILRKNTRSTDTVARYGGEEFCVVLRHTTDRQAYTVAEKLRLFIADQVFLCEKKKPFHITCSFGVYQISPKLKKITQVFEIVDGALYTAKNSGRNCVVLV
jgi:diguanylate cyclase (GGDEF)-like protein